MKSAKVKATIFADRISKFIKNAFKTGKEKRTEGYLKARVQLLERYWDSFQLEHEKLCDVATAKEIESDNYFVNDTFSDIECAYMEAKAQLFDELQEYQIVPTLHQESLMHSPTTPSQSVQSVKLPKVNLPTFTGCHTDWPSFRDTYVSLIHENESLSSIQKMHYLKSAVSGEAAPLLKHLAVTSCNYTSAWDILTARYENQRLLVNSYLSVLSSTQSMSSENAKELRRVLDSFTQAIRALKNLKRPTNRWDDWLVFLLSNKLDPITRKDWETSLSTATAVPSFESLETFLQGRLHTLDALKGLSKSDRNEKKSTHTNRPIQYAARAYHTSSSKICILCQGRHILLFCPGFRAKSISERQSFVRNQNLCVNCLKVNHSLQSCPSTYRCKHCNGKHHSMLHTENRTAIDSQPRASSQIDTSAPNALHTQASISTQAYLSGKLLPTGSIILATAVVVVQAPNGRTIRARALLDQGSESSFITSSLANLLKLSKKGIQLPVSGVGGCQAGIAEFVVKHNIISTVDPNFVLSIRALVMPTLTSFIPSQPITREDWPHIIGLTLADPDFHIPANVDLILGADVYARILLSGVRQGPHGTPVAQQTRLGWILSGAVENKCNTPPTTISLHCSLDDTNELLRKFWEVEEVPKLVKLTPDEDECETFFKVTHKRSSTGRYIVKLPLKSASSKLGVSRHSAVSALLRMECRFKRQPELQQLYVDFMDEYGKLGHMELVSNEEEGHIHRRYYLPHHAVLKSSSTTTKMRAVFNASQQTDSGLSLNDLLHTGAKLQNDVSVIILNWRVYPFAFSSDIEKMYRQIYVDSEDTDLQRILWRRHPSATIQCYRLKTVTYGTACAPYLACRTLLQLATDYQSEFPIGSKILKENIYVDDALFGEFNHSSAIDSRDELSALLNRGGFKLRKWVSNVPELLDDLPDQDKEARSSLRLVTDEKLKTLGISWNPTIDQLSLPLDLPPIIAITKRSVLSDISKIFDPLGWVSPVTIRVKIFMQHLWLAKLDWDEQLPLELSNTWTKYRNDMGDISVVKIPRWIGTDNSHLAVELHGFCDASMAAYGAVVYLRIIHDFDNVQLSLLTSKTRVSPLKTISLPRLELCGATLLADLVSFVQTSLNIEVSSIHAWTDSTIVLAWLRDHPSRWKVFVSNRVSAIHEQIPTATWHHVSSQDNPADCLTRGVTPLELQNHHLWWSGPLWLTQHSSKWPCPITTTITAPIPEEKQQIMSHVVQDPDPSSDLLYRYSTLQKLLRISAYCLRFIFNAKADKLKRVTGVLKPSETNAALNRWITKVQDSSFQEDQRKLLNNQSVSSKSKLRALHPFLDENQLIRIGGRLENSLLSFSQKHPIILPKDSHLTQLIIDHSHKTTLHGGTQLTLHHIRDTFWILNGRSAVRKFVRNCIPCYRQKAKTKNQIMSNLPADRLRPSKPFLQSGVDYPGPIKVKAFRGRRQNSFKAYIAVFICLVTRAIHIELVMDLTSEAFLAAFKRFVARRGHCAKLYSDNATNFVAADKQLTSQLRQLMNDTSTPIDMLLSKEGTEWHFIPPAAPHFGGLWEAGVKSLKHHLRRVVGDHLLTIEEMLTLLTQVEACLNSRPLHPISDDPEDFSALTPGHFLVGESLIAVPEVSTTNITENRLNRWQLIQNMYEQLWSRWYKEYAHHLQLRYKWTHKQESVKINDLVLIKDDKLPPTKWLLGRIVAVHPGPDNSVRVVTVKYQGGCIKRPITKICVLPIDAQN